MSSTRMAGNSCWWKVCGRPVGRRRDLPMEITRVTQRPPSEWRLGTKFMLWSQTYPWYRQYQKLAFWEFLKSAEIASSLHNLCLSHCFLPNEVPNRKWNMLPWCFRSISAQWSCMQWWILVHATLLTNSAISVWWNGDLWCNLRSTGYWFRCTRLNCNLMLESLVDHLYLWYLHSNVNPTNSSTEWRCNATHVQTHPYVDAFRHHWQYSVPNYWRLLWVGSRAQLTSGTQYKSATSAKI